MLYHDLVGGLVGGGRYAKELNELYWLYELPELVNARRVAAPRRVVLCSSTRRRPLRASSASSFSSLTPPPIHDRHARMPPVLRHSCPTNTLSSLLPISARVPPPTLAAHESCASLRDPLTMNIL